MCTHGPLPLAVPTQLALAGVALTRASMGLHESWPTHSHVSMTTGESVVETYAAQTYTTKSACMLHKRLICSPQQTAQGCSAQMLETSIRLLEPHPVEGRDRVTVVLSNSN